MTSQFSLQTAFKQGLILELKECIENSDSHKLLVCCSQTIDLIHHTFQLSELIELGISSVDRLDSNRKKDIKKGVIYFCYPSLEIIQRIIQDFENEMYIDCCYLSPKNTPDECIEIVKKSNLNQFLHRWVDNIGFDFTTFDSRSFHFDMDNSIPKLYKNQPLDDLDLLLDQIAEKMISVVKILNQVPIIKYYDSKGTGETLAARMAWKLQTKVDNEQFDSAYENDDKKNVDIILIDRSFDCFTPLTRSFHYQAAILDLLEVDGDMVRLNDKSVQLTEDDPFFVRLRHQYLGEAGETINNLITETPSAANFYGRSRNRTISDLKDQILSIEEGRKIMEHHAIFDSLSRLFTQGQLELLGDLEQCLATEETANLEPLPSTILNEIGNALRNPIFNYNDKLRLLLICSLRFPNNDLSNALKDHFGVEAIDGIVGSMILSGLDSPLAKTDPEWRYTHLGWQAYLKTLGKPLPPFDPEDFLSRYQPSLNRLLEDLIMNGANSVQPFRPKDTPSEVAEDNAGRQGSFVGFTQTFTPQWATLQPENPNEKQFIDYLDHGRRVLVFVLGGISVSEIQCIHECVPRLGRDFIIGSTNIGTPSSFVNELCLLGEGKSNVLKLTSIFDEIELEKERKKKQHAQALQEKLRLELDEAATLKRMVTMRHFKKSSSIMDALADLEMSDASMTQPPVTYQSTNGRVKTLLENVNRGNQIRHQTTLSRRITFSREASLLKRARSINADAPPLPPRYINPPMSYKTPSTRQMTDTNISPVDSDYSFEENDTPTTVNVFSVPSSVPEPSVEPEKLSEDAIKKLLSNPTIVRHNNQTGFAKLAARLRKLAQESLLAEDYSRLNKPKEGTQGSSNWNQSSNSGSKPSKFTDPPVGYVIPTRRVKPPNVSSIQPPAPMFAPQPQVYPERQQSIADGSPVPFHAEPRGLSYGSSHYGGQPVIHSNRPQSMQFASVDRNFARSTTQPLPPQSYQDLIGSRPQSADIERSHINRPDSSYINRPESIASGRSTNSRASFLGSFEFERTSSHSTMAGPPAEYQRQGSLTESPDQFGPFGQISPLTPPQRNISIPGNLEYGYDYPQGPIPNMNHNPNTSFVPNARPNVYPQSQLPQHISQGPLPPQSFRLGDNTRHPRPQSFRTTNTFPMHGDPYGHDPNRRQPAPPNQFQPGTNRPNSYSTN
ncbi:Sec1-like protein [Globomyces pollinis-pini]|nr:Sec1-like protein [Globomyces pollinis-pini]